VKKAKRHDIDVPEAIGQVDLTVPNFGARNTWNDRLRLLGLLPIMLIIGGYEYVHAFGGTFPIPFLAMFSAVVLAAVTGGRAFGIIAAILSSAEMFHCYQLGIGPPPLTGTRRGCRRLCELLNLGTVRSILRPAIANIVRPSTPRTSG